VNLKVLKADSEKTYTKDVINYAGNKGKLVMPKLDMRNLNPPEERSNHIIISLK
jgi:hypothetical protein